MNHLTLLLLFASIITLTVNAQKAIGPRLNAVEGTTLTITCSGGKIKVYNAWYGDYNAGVCTSCCYADVTLPVETKCNNKATCSVLASNALVGKDPCQGKTKYLVVEQGCI